MDNIPSEMLRGHIDTIILLCLVDNDKHTTQIKEEIEQRAGGGFELKQGTFYSCLQRIVKQGYVTEYRTSNTPDGVRRKFYQLTEKGKVYIDENKDIWEYSRKMINTLISVPEKPEEVAVSDSSTSSKEDVAQVAVEEELSPEETLKSFLSSQMSDGLDQNDGIIENKRDAEPDESPEKPAEKPFIEESRPNIDAASHNSAKREKDRSKDNYDLFTLIDYTQSDIIPAAETEREDSFEIAAGDGYNNIFAPEETENAQKIAQKPSDEKDIAESYKEPTNEKPQDRPFVEMMSAKPIKADDIAEKPVEPQLEMTENKPSYAPRATETVNPTLKQEPGEKDDYFDPDSLPASDYRSVLSKIFDSPTGVDQQKEERPVVVDYNEGFDINTFFNKNEPITADGKKGPGRLARGRRGGDRRSPLSPRRGSAETFAALGRMPRRGAERPRRARRGGVGGCRQPADAAPLHSGARTPAALAPDPRGGAAPPADAPQGRPRGGVDGRQGAVPRRTKR